ALRARKQSHILTLEQKVADLTHENVLLKQQIQLLSIAVPTTTETAPQVPCLNPNCIAQIQALQCHVLKLEQSAGGKSSPRTDSIASRLESSGSDSGNEDFIVFENTDNNRNWGSAVQFYGPIDIEPFKNQLKNIASLRNSKAPGRLFDLIEVVSKSTETREARRLMLKIIREHIRIQEKCNILDMVQYANIISEYRAKYKKHETHWREILAFEHHPVTNRNTVNTTSPAAAVIPQRVQMYRESLRKIPSLANYHEVIDDICRFFSSDEQYGEHEFFQLHFAIHSMMAACETVEDMRQFWLAFFIVRQSKRAEMDDLLAKVEANTIEFKTKLIQTTQEYLVKYYVDDEYEANICRTPKVDYLVTGVASVAWQPPTAPTCSHKTHSNAASKFTCDVAASRPKPPKVKNFGNDKPEITASLNAKK
ncbi:hypothetical protein HK100_012887, partial [Physocladia obscura]